MFNISLNCVGFISAPEPQNIKCQVGLCILCQFNMYNIIHVPGSISSITAVLYIDSLADKMYIFTMARH